MAGYSGTPLVKKLGLRAGARVWIAQGPAGFRVALDPLPEGVAFLRVARAPVDVAIVFARRAAELRSRFETARRALAPAGGLWVAWPKQSSGVATELNETLIREFGLSTGLVDNKVCAIDDVWSGLRFVIRTRDRR